MKLSAPKEIHPGETRAALVPEHVAKLVKRGAQIEVESGMGLASGHGDADYAAAGATVTGDRRALLAGADVVVRVRKPPHDEIPLLQPGSIHISHLDPFQSAELVEGLASGGISAISMELIPRTTRAQKMDALSSQANLAGYVAVIVGANESNRIFPMMMTAAGTILPARVFVIGAGVAGLQAIATARRLGARVEAYDTRPVVEEQVRSLGARFVKIDVGETGQTKDGYARALTDDQLQRQRQAMTRVCAESDVVITTAQVFGRRAPILVTAEMLDAMKPGSVVVDLAIEGGGNVEGAVADEIQLRRGVKIVAWSNLPGRVPAHASQVYSANVTGFIEEFWDPETQSLKLNLEDEIIRGCLVTHGGRIVNERLAGIPK